MNIVQLSFALTDLAEQLLIFVYLLSRPPLLILFGNVPVFAIVAYSAHLITFGVFAIRVSTIRPLFVV